MGIAAGGLYIKYDVVGAGWRMIYGTLAILCRLAPPLTSFREENHLRFCTPDGLSCLTILFLYRPAQKRPDVSAVFHNHRYEIMAIDPVGVLLLACGVCPLYYGLVSALNPYKWSDAHVLGPLCAGLAGFACFGLWGTCYPTCPSRASVPLTDSGSISQSGKAIPRVFFTTPSSVDPAITHSPLPCSSQKGEPVGLRLLSALAPAHHSLCAGFSSSPSMPSGLGRLPQSSRSRPGRPG